MNPSYTDFRFPQIKAHPWHKVFHKRMPPEVIDLATRLLQYSPSLRCTALEACTYHFFDELREPNARLPNGHTSGGSGVDVAVEALGRPETFCSVYRVHEMEEKP